MKAIQVGIRFPLDVKAWLERQAQANRSSQNSEVVRAVRKQMKAAGAEFGDHSPAAEKIEKNPNHQEVTSHDGDDSTIRV